MPMRNVRTATDDDVETLLRLCTIGFLESIGYDALALNDGQLAAFLAYKVRRPE